MNDLRRSLQAARRLHAGGGGTVFDELLRTTGLDAATLGDLLSREAGVSVLPLAGAAEADFDRVDREVARRLRAVALHWPGEALPRLGMADPWADDAVREVSALLGATPRIVALPGSVLEALLGPTEATDAPARDPSRPAMPLAASASGPVVDFVDEAIRGAFVAGASDVHFECDRSGVNAKLRLDGVMTSFARLADAARAEEVVSRIKVLAQLDITERRTPQDGRFRFAVDPGRVIDLRVSIMPSVFGEDAVLRLLDKAQLRARDEQVTLDRLGFDADSRRRIRALAALPHGMLLVTGPTGSGKTTTVYATLSEINTGLEKIITIEDPVEYELPGVLQIPVNERKGLTFAKGLRSILRHDPDRILVGEIRDAETAEIAVQSALTGHQVLTTVHANSIFDVTGRFRHFGLDMFGFMASLNGVIVQRLLRRLCPKCVATRALDDDARPWFTAQGQAVDAVPLAVGCPECRQSGYKGRVVLAEVHMVDDTFRDLTTGASSVGTLRRHVEASGVASLSRQGARLVVEGVTSLDEVRRVLGWM